MFRIKVMLKCLYIVLILALLTAVLPILYALYQPQSPLVQGIKADKILIHNINILSPDYKNLLTNRAVVIKDNTIQDLPDDDINRDDFDLVIDGNDQFLMPGLTDAHTHIYDRTDLLLNLAHGITQIRVMHGVELQLALKDEVSKGTTIGPDMLVASPAINQRSQYASSEFHQFIENGKEARELVKQYKDKGYDLIKIYDGLDKDNFDAVRKACKEFDIPFAGHSPFAVATKELINTNIQSLEHIEMLYQAALNYSQDEHDLTVLINKLKQNPVPITTTLIVYDELAQAAELKSQYLKSKPLDYIPPFIKSLSEPNINHIMAESKPENWRSKADYLGYMAKKLFDADLPLILGSDAGANYTINGIGMIQEMLLLKNYGVSSADILTSATRTPAKALQLEHKGTIDVGYKANLIITKSDPRKDLTTFLELQGLIKDGIYYDQHAIKQMKTKAKEHMASFEFLGWIMIDWWQRNLHF